MFLVGIVVITNSHLAHKILHNMQLQNVRRVDSIHGIDIAMASQTSLKLERKGPVGRSAVQVWLSNAATQEARR